MGGGSEPSQFSCATAEVRNIKTGASGCYELAIFNEPLLQPKAAFAVRMATSERHAANCRGFLDETNNLVRVIKRIGRLTINRPWIKRWDAILSESWKGCGHAFIGGIIDVNQGGRVTVTKDRSKNNFQIF